MTHHSVARETEGLPVPVSRPALASAAVEPMRIAILEDHDLFAEALQVALSLEQHEVHRVPLVDHAGSTAQLLAAVLRLHVHVVLLDLDLGDAGNGARLVTPLTEAGVQVVVVTGSTERARWGECVHLGALTVLPKTMPLSGILATIRLLAEGQPVLEEQVRDAWLTAFRLEGGQAQATRSRLESLTSREGEVLAYLMAGRRVRDIAASSCVAETTVRSQVKSILTKLDVSSQVAAVGAAYKARWRPPTLPSAPDFTDLRDAPHVQPS